MKASISHLRGIALACLALVTGLALPAQSAKEKPWMNRNLSPEQRVELVLAQMTLEEKLLLLHGQGMARDPGLTAEAELALNGGVGMAWGVPRLGLPPILMSDAAYGVRASADNGRYSTALPGNLASAASWDKNAACDYGTLIGKELRAQGFDMTLGGGVNLAREPRNGRTFEYMGEDPVLAGTMVGQRIRCEGDQHILSDIKHFALNDQESGRTKVDSRIGEQAARQSDLLAFEIGVKTGHPKAVMCSYNGVNGDYACENRWLLTDLLRNQWGFRGFVVSDWGATHSTEKASAAGLDIEEPGEKFFGKPLLEAVKAGHIPMSEIDEHVRHILWAEFVSGIVDDPPHRSVVDPEAGFAVARKIEEESAVLLRNQSSLLPLKTTQLHSIAVIGEHADMGMISGGGSAQVDPPGAMAGQPWVRHVWFPTSPLAAIRSKAPGARISFTSGKEITEAVDAAKQAEVAIVFAWQWESEDHDLPDLSLPGNQNELIRAVAQANPHTIVVLETGSPVVMPWIEATGAVMEVWYAGNKGADAMAELLFGDVNPSGKLPISFVRTEADLPRPEVAKPAANSKEDTLSFSVNYSEGEKIGYKWLESQHKAALFPFGFGLSYTSFRYSNLSVAADGSSVRLEITNTGERSGAEVAEVYATLPEPTGIKEHRLVGFDRVEIAPGTTQTVNIPLQQLALSVWDVAAKKWTQPSGSYEVRVGGSSIDLPLQGTFKRP